MSKPKKQKPLQLILLFLLILLMIVSIAVSFIPVGRAQEPATEVTATSDGRLCADGQVLVKFKSIVSERAAEQTLSAMSSEALDTSNNIVIADVPAGETVESFVETLEDQSSVEYAQPNYLYVLQSVSVNDTFVAEQWHLNVMGIQDAWSTTMGSPSVTVAILDTGADLNHPDLNGQMIRATDIVDKDGSAQDDNGHGTHVAGIIGAVTNNAKGVAGIAPGIKLMPVDVFGYYDTPKGTVFGALTSKVIEGVGYAVANEADIINISLGGADYDSAFEDSVDDAVAQGVVVVAAAGNKGENGIHYPSDFDSSISVIATDWNDNRASYSNYGEEKDICAPGGDDNAEPETDSLILSTYYDPKAHTSGYAWMSGTSMASPMVAGVVALMLSANPSLTVSQVKNILFSTAVDLNSPGHDEETGYGRINAAAAVAAAAGKAYSPLPVTGVSLSDISVSLAMGETYQLSATVSPFGASNKAVIFSSSNPAVAEVSPYGSIRVAGVGSAVITASTADGHFTSSCSVSVIMPAIPVTGIMITGFAPEARTTHFVGESFDIVPVVSPQNATNKSVTYNSTAPSVAAIDSTGHIRAMGVGTTTITVTTADKNLSTFIVLDVLRRGDANGDGHVSISDYSLIRLHILSLKSLSAGYQLAADVDKNGNISIADYTLVRLQILGLKSID